MTRIGTVALIAFAMGATGVHAQWLKQDLGKDDPSTFKCLPSAVANFWELIGN